MILEPPICQSCKTGLYQLFENQTCLNCKTEFVAVAKKDLDKIIATSNRIDLILDGYKDRIPLGVWCAMNDLNVERCDIFGKYNCNWEDLG